MSIEVEVGQLREQVAQRDKTIETLRKENAKYRTDRNGKVKEAEEGKAELQAEYDKLRKEHDKALKQLEELPKETAQENERLKGEIRMGKYRSEFDRLAKEAKADPRALDALWKLAEVDTGSDEVDVDGLKKTISSALEKNPFLAEVSAPRPPQPGPGGGQGAKPNQVGNGFRMTAAQHADPSFTRSHWAEIQAASMAGNLIVE